MLKYSWKSCNLPEFPHLYISRFGLARWMNCQGQWTDSLGTPNNSGLLQITIRNDENLEKKFCVHSLVGIAFVEKQCLNFTILTHINKNLKDNRATNLTWTDRVLLASRKHNAIQKTKNNYFVRFSFNRRLYTVKNKNVINLKKDVETLKAKLSNEYYWTKLIETAA